MNSAVEFKQVPTCHAVSRAVACLRTGPPVLVHMQQGCIFATVTRVQVHTLLKGLEKIANSANIPMVIAGDLNSIPGSAPHSLIVDRYVDITKHGLSADPLNLFSLDKTSMPSHSLNLYSIYSAAYRSAAQSAGLDRLRSQLDDNFHEPKYTNITHDFKDTLDYIYYTSPELELTGVLDLPHLGDMLDGDMSSGLPNSKFASDHVALMAEFEFGHDRTL